jgi:hypothetical protein
MADGIPWLLTAIGIIASLAWNWFNYTRTTKLQKTLRGETVRLEEFRRVRTPIDAALTEMRAEMEVLKALARSGAKLAEIKESAATAQKAITAKYLKLQIALEDADSSQFAEGADWLPPVEIIWDTAISQLDAVYAKNAKEIEVQAALSDSCTTLSELTRQVGKRIDTEVNRFAYPT